MCNFVKPVTCSRRIFFFYQRRFTMYNIADHKYRHRGMYSKRSHRRWEGWLFAEDSHSRERHHFEGPETLLLNPWHHYFQPSSSSSYTHTSMQNHSLCLMLPSLCFRLDCTQRMPTCFHLSISDLYWADKVLATSIIAVEYIVVNQNI